MCLPLPLRRVLETEMCLRDLSRLPSLQIEWGLRHKVSQSLPFSHHEIWSPPRVSKGRSTWKTKYFIFEPLSIVWGLTTLHLDWDWDRLGPNQIHRLLEGTLNIFIFSIPCIYSSEFFFCKSAIQHQTIHFWISNRNLICSYADVILRNQMCSVSFELFDSIHIMFWFSGFKFSMFILKTLHCSCFPISKLHVMIFLGNKIILKKLAISITHLLFLKTCHTSTGTSSGDLAVSLSPGDYAIILYHQ